MNAHFIVTADTFYGCQLIEAPEDQTNFLDAENFIANLGRLEDGDTMWTTLDRAQAEHIHAEYGISGYTPLEEEEDDE
jgi:hypothetical protein